MCKRPDDGHLAFLLGTAIGVMGLLSVVELWVNNGAGDRALLLAGQYCRAPPTAAPLRPRLVQASRGAPLADALCCHPKSAAAKHGWPEISGTFALGVLLFQVVSLTAAVAREGALTCRRHLWTLTRHRQRRHPWSPPTPLPTDPPPAA